MQRIADLFSTGKRTGREVLRGLAWHTSAQGHLGARPRTGCAEGILCGEARAAIATTGPVASSSHLGRSLRLPPGTLCRETGSLSPAVFLPKYFSLVFILL